MKIRASSDYILNSKSETNLAEILLTNFLLSDSFSTKPCQRILISFFVFKLECFFFFIGSDNDLLSLTSTAHYKRKNTLDKNPRHGF